MYKDKMANNIMLVLDRVKPTASHIMEKVQINK
jgi:hypothetical protein